MGNGSFSTRFAKRKRWKLDEGLLAALRLTLTDAEFIADFGAGGGKYVEWIRKELGLNAIGFDGTPGIGEISGGLVHELDLSHEMGAVRIAGVADRIDAAICIETGEHVPEEKLPAFLRNVTLAPRKRLVVSWATPGQRGRDHVSCRLPEWVASEVCRRGWLLNHEVTVAARKAAGEGWSRKLLVFDRG